MTISSCRFLFPRKYIKPPARARSGIPSPRPTPIPTFITSLLPPLLVLVLVLAGGFVELEPTGSGPVCEGPVLLVLVLVLVLVCVLDSELLLAWTDWVRSTVTSRVTVF